METCGEGLKGLCDGLNSGLCASIAALVVALDEGGALHRDRYEEILGHFWAKLPDDQADGDAGAVIEQVLELVVMYAHDKAGCSIDLENGKQLLTAQVSASNGREYTDEPSSKNRSSKHAPLLGAPFVV